MAADLQSPPPLRGRVREGGSSSWQMSAHAHFAAIRPTQKKSSGQFSDATHWDIASDDNIQLVPTSSISPASTASSSSKPMAVSTMKSAQAMTQRAPHGLKSAVTEFSASGITTSLRTSKVSPKSFSSNSPNLSNYGTIDASSSKTIFVRVPPTQPSPSRGEGFKAKPLASAGDQ
jgi:hypothetical protein